MLQQYLSIISPPEQVFPYQAMTSQNVALSPESPGTSSLMVARDGTSINQSSKPLDDLPVEMVKKPVQLGCFCGFNRIKLASVSRHNWSNQPVTNISVKGTTENKQRGVFLRFSHRYWSPLKEKMKTLQCAAVCLE